MKALAARAARIGASDPEGAAQEAVKRSLLNALSRSALDYYFHEQPPAASDSPAWTLLQLMGWLHGVLRFVVLEERVRARREIPTAEHDLPEMHDPTPSQLEHLIEAESHAMVDEALSTLNAGHRSALLLRLQGSKYADIAARLGINENTVATWVRRGSRALALQVQRRMDGSHHEDGSVRRGVARASNG